jgi:hypothetical protein
MIRKFRKGNLKNIGSSVPAAFLEAFLKRKYKYIGNISTIALRVLLLNR